MNAVPRKHIGRLAWTLAIAGTVSSLPVPAQVTNVFGGQVPAQVPWGQTNGTTSPGQNSSAPPANQGGEQNSGMGQGSADDVRRQQQQQGYDNQNSRGQQRDLQRPFLPPDRPTELQQLVQISTGQQIAIFGSALFRQPPSTFAPVDNIPVTPDYVVGPGDELRIQVWGQVSNQGSFPVDRTGSISVPQLGTVHVAGLRFADVTPFMRAQFGRVYRNFDLNVNMGQLRSIQVFVVGQARQPGSYTVGSLSTLVNALFASGGPTPQGSLRDIQLRRGSETVVHFDLYDLLLRGDKSKDAPLQPGDVLFIPPAGPQVALTGSVINPAIYELRGETTAQQLLDLTGGRTSVAAGTTVRIERIADHAARSVEEVNLATGPAVVLQSGDIITVNAIVDRFRNAVTLRGNVANPGRYSFHAGMRVTDLLPDREALVTRNYWIRRNQLGQAPVDFLPAMNSQAFGQRGTQAGQNGSPYDNRYGTQPDSSYNSGGSFNGSNGGNGQMSGQGSLMPDEGSLRVSTEGVTPGSRTVGSNTNQADNGSGSRSGSSSSSGGGTAVAAAALAGAENIFPVRNDVVLSAPDIDWSYAVIERQDPVTLKTSLLPFNLGRAVLDSDAAQNLDLQPNDVVTIFSTADIRVPSDQQTRFVRLEGEFGSAGVYSVHPGETLRQLLTRAGGFTPDAYLYASEFTRQSTRRVEQQRLNDYANQLEAQVSAATSGASARALTDRDAAAADSSASQARGAIARLRQLQPIGRIVLQLKPDSRGVDSVPDIALEDGDRFIVPKVPANVYVEGEVYSANAFVFERGQRTNRYLRLAGGPNREADRSRSFVLRADGSVYSRQYGNLEHALIFPGDTIVVPPVINKRAILRDLVDISNIIGGFGVGVAAINVLK